jgi:hypothetical protein
VNDPTQGTRVVQLACRRFEDALAEGTLGPPQVEHARGCEACQKLAADLEATLAALRHAAAGPRELPAGFATGVLRRVGDLSALPRRGREHRSGFLLGAAAVGLAAVVTWFAIGDPPLRVRTHLPVAVGQAPHPDAEPSPRAIEAVARPRPDPAEPRIRPAAAPATPPVVPEAVPVPEPKPDLPRELRAMIRDQVRLQSDCPAHTAQPIQVRFTVGRDGKLSNRTIYSDGGDRRAHDCVGTALSRLMLPPLPAEREVSLEVTW